MIVFATPDFGASGYVVLVIWVVGLLTFWLVAAGVAIGLRLFRSESSRRRLCGGLLLLVSGLTPFLCCLGPSQAIRLVYGNYPIGSYPTGKIKPGMSPDEVVATLGTPHERFKQGDVERWFYWIDAYGIHWFGVDFGPDGRVGGTYGN
jgi:hypothetical protein